MTNQTPEMKIWNMEFDVGRRYDAEARKGTARYTAATENTKGGTLEVRRMPTGRKGGALRYTLNGNPITREEAIAALR